MPRKKAPAKKNLALEAARAGVDVAGKVTGFIAGMFSIPKVKEAPAKKTSAKKSAPKKKTRPTSSEPPKPARKTVKAASDELAKAKKKSSAKKKP